MKTLIAILVCLIPLAVAVIFSKGLNIIIGLFMYPFTAFAMLIVGQFVPKFAGLTVVNGTDYNLLNQQMISFLHRNTFDRISFINGLSWKLWLEVGVWAVLFIIFLLVSVKIKKHAKKRMINKYSNVRIVQPRY